MPTGLANVTVDAEGALRDWLKTLTSSLVGVGQPLSNVFLDELTRSPGKGTWAVLSRIGGAEAWNEACADNARITCSIFGFTKQAAANAARAYANTLRTLSVVQPVMTAYGVTIRMADNLIGPTWIPNLDKNLPQYLVDADVYFLPTT